MRVMVYSPKKFIFASLMQIDINSMTENMKKSVYSHEVIIWRSISCSEHPSIYVKKQHIYVYNKYIYKIKVEKKIFLAYFS